MHVLVAVASRHGSTFDIATMIGAELERSGIEVTVAPPELIESVDEYDAVILGSAVYVGRWLESARFRRTDRVIARGPARLAVLERPGRRAAQAERRGARRCPDRCPRRRAVAPRLRRRVNPDSLGIGERAILSLVRAQAGDFRRWGDVRAWSALIASELSTLA